MCDGFLNKMLCFDLDDARTKIAAWALDFNVKRRMLRYLPPAAYAAPLTATDDRLRNPDQLRRSTNASPARFRPNSNSFWRKLSAAGHFTSFFLNRAAVALARRGRLTLRNTQTSVSTIRRRAEWLQWLVNCRIRAMRSK
jgi:hypothetical protein